MFRGSGHVQEEEKIKGLHTGKSVFRKTVMNMGGFIHNKKNIDSGFFSDIIGPNRNTQEIYGRCTI